VEGGLSLQGSKFTYIKCFMTPHHWPGQIIFNVYSTLGAELSFWYLCNAGATWQWSFHAGDQRARSQQVTVSYLLSSLGQAVQANDMIWVKLCSSLAFTWSSVCTLVAVWGSLAPVSIVRRHKAAGSLWPYFQPTQAMSCNSFYIRFPVSVFLYEGSITGLFGAL
jgi:hypothetical protein